MLYSLKWLWISEGASVRRGDPSCCSLHIVRFLLSHCRLFTISPEAPMWPCCKMWCASQNSPTLHPNKDVLNIQPLIEFLFSPLKGKHFKFHMWRLLRDCFKTFNQVQIILCLSKIKCYLFSKEIHFRGVLTIGYIPFKWEEKLNKELMLVTQWLWQEWHHSRFRHINTVLKNVFNCNLNLWKKKNSSMLISLLPVWSNLFCKRAWWPWWTWLLLPVLSCSRFDSLLLSPICFKVQLCIRRCSSAYLGSDK